MFCSNCGNKINNGESFCGECGTKITQVNNSINLVVSRPSGVMGFAIALHVKIDDSISFDLSNGSENRLNLPVGNHVIKYKVWCRREQVVNVNIDGSKICSVIFEYDPLWGGFKVSNNSVLS